MTLSLYGFTLIPAWTTDYFLYNVLDETNHPSPNFNNCMIEVLEMINHLSPFPRYVITCPC